MLDLPQRLIKCFVLLGSAVSILDSFEDLKAPEGKPLTEDHWNTVRSLSLALHSIIVTDIKSRRLKGMRYCLSPLLRYNVGKKVAELAAVRITFFRPTVYNLILVWSLFLRCSDNSIAVVIC